MFGMTFWLPPFTFSTKNLLIIKQIINKWTYRVQITHPLSLEAFIHLSNQSCIMEALTYTPDSVNDKFC